MQNNPFAPPGVFDWGHRKPGEANPFGPSPMMAQQTGVYPPQQPQYAPQQQYGNQLAPQQTGYAPPQSPISIQQPQPTGFRPSSSFGVQLQAQMTGMQQQQPMYQQSQQTGYQPQQFQQQQQQQQPYLHDLDPLNIPPGWQSGPSSAVSPAPVASSLANAVSQTFKPEDHPRQVVQRHKAGLESWDQYSWTQVKNAYADLQKAWEERKAKLMRALDGGLNPRDGEICRGLIAEADDRIDSMTAAKLQLEEARTGFRQSTDAASKGRVRDAINASLRALPDWPEELDLRPSQQPQQQPMQTGYPQQAYQQPQPTGYAQYQQPQATGYAQPGYQQPQPTGYQIGQFMNVQPTGYGYGRAV